MCNECCNKINEHIYFILLQVWFYVQEMFILFQQLFYFIAHETTPMLT